MERGREALKAAALAGPSDTPDVIIAERANAKCWKATVLPTSCFACDRASGRPVERIDNDRGTLHVAFDGHLRQPKP